MDEFLQVEKFTYC